MRGDDEGRENNMEEDGAQYWGLSLDDIAEAVYYDIQSDAIGGHYAAFKGTRDEARAKMIDVFIRLIDKYLYMATSYGAKWTEEDDN